MREILQKDELSVKWGRGTWQEFLLTKRWNKSERRTKTGNFLQKNWSAEKWQVKYGEGGPEKVEELRS
ncbi:MAG: hypothetical protein WCO56_22630 [Verrucomicrobiota bacterium]